MNRPMRVRRITYAVDPEMLGRIFENLLASQNEETEKLANQRKAFGAFYTPREIVDYMVNESIKAFLQTQWEQHLKLKKEDRGQYNYIVNKEFDMLPQTMIKLLSEKEKRTENLQKVMDMLRLLKNVKEGKTNFEKAENEFMEKRSEEYLYPVFGGRDKFYQIAEENKKKQEKNKK